MTRFLPDGFIIWKVKLGKYESTKPAWNVFVAAPDIMTAHKAVMDYEKEMLQDNDLVLSIEVVSDCILDGTQQEDYGATLNGKVRG